MTLFLSSFDPYATTVRGIGAIEVTDELVTFDKRYSTPRLLKKIGMVLFTFGAPHLELVSLTDGGFALACRSGRLKRIIPRVTYNIEQVSRVIPIRTIWNRIEKFGCPPEFNWWVTRLRWLLANFDDDQCTHCYHQLSIRDLTFIETPHAVWYHHHRYELDGDCFRCGRRSLKIDEEWWKLGRIILINSVSRHPRYEVVEKDDRTFLQKRKNQKKKQARSHT